MTTFANGARQFVVHDAFEMTWCCVGVVLVEVDAEHDGDVLALGRRGDDDLLGAAASRCLAAFSRSVKKPVDSITTSTPRSPHGSVAGSRSARTLQLLAVDDQPVVRRPRPFPGTARGSSRT